MTMDKTYVITVRGTPKSVNEGGGGARVNHFAAHSEKKKWEGLIMMELLAARVPKPMQFCTVSVTLHFKNKSGGKGRDKENFRHPVIKPLADALVAGGYLKDDGEEWFTVGDFELEVGPEEWPFRDPRLKSYMDIKLEAQYL
jgi:hypothetical protein